MGKLVVLLASESTSSARKQNICFIVKFVASSLLLVLAGPLLASEGVEHQYVLSVVLR